MHTETLVLGLGNPLLQDDRVGIRAVELLREQQVPVPTEVLFTVGFEVVDKVMGRKRVIIVDASTTGNVPGTITEVSVDDIFATHTLRNSHAMTLGTTLQTGYTLFPDRMPKDIKIMLIEADDIDHFSDQCTPDVEQAVHDVVRRIIGYIA
jgi:hydrogenase maturation protease